MGGLPVVGDDGLEQARGEDALDTKALRDGWRGKLVTCAAGRGGSSKQSSYVRVFDIHGSTKNGATGNR